MQFDGTINAGNLLEVAVFIWGLVIYFSKQDKKIALLAASIDGVKHDIARLEAKQDKYNHLQERTIAVAEMSKQRTQNLQLGEARRRDNQKRLDSWINSGIEMADGHWTLVVVGRSYVLYPCLLKGVTHESMGYK